MRRTVGESSNQLGAREPWHCYLLECADGTYYAGITTDMGRRVDEHNRGVGARYTRPRRPVRVVYVETHPDRSSATRREIEIKKLTRAAKRTLARGGAAPVTHTQILENLVSGVSVLRFAEPVTHVYNPLVYARAAHDAYWERYGAGPKEVLLLGMNPGPHGMAQTGVPFGEVGLVREWLGIEAPVGRPGTEHPKRPVQGFACPRSEVSGRRLWGWARDRFGSPAAFFARFFVANYCPLVFMEASGRNRTPDKLPAAERAALFAVCDRALVRTVELLAPRIVIGIGKFAEDRVRLALGDGVRIGRITHPSPANPRANRGWAARVEAELAALGIPVP